MVELIKRCPEYTMGYKEYCQELYDNRVIYFRPTNPKSIDDNWFFRTQSWYDKKEKGLMEGQPISFHYWAIDNGRFIGEFQLRTDFSEKVMLEIGSIGYAVRVSQWGKGYGTEILRLGLELAKKHGMKKVLLTINDQNKASIHICEKLGGVLMDTIEAYNEAEGHHRLRRYWIIL
ncbi:MAG: GNAT family N-acetyltransferase [Clostridia bacterium]|nr:GNAT family N-acetyltransferase [Clostridia bacterium]